MEKNYYKQNDEIPDVQEYEHAKKTGSKGVKKNYNFFSNIGFVISSFYLGFVFIYYSDAQVKILEKINAMSSLGFLFLIIGGLFLIKILSKKFSERETSEKHISYEFSSIDDDFITNNEVNNETLKALIDDLKNKVNSIEEVSKDDKDDYEYKKRELYSFESYFHSIRHLLEQKSTMADKKASILLDKGIAYTKLGISFYIISIIIWQFLFLTFGYRANFVWGIASCSFVFIFMEFLSAWFLKQYKNFTDTSTYLLKVKSIFDKYMLLYLVYEDEMDEDSKKIVRSNLIEFIIDDIKWPGEVPVTNESFAKETIESITSLVEKIKNKSE